MRVQVTLRTLLSAVLLGSRIATAVPGRGSGSVDDKPCPPFSGNLTLHEYQLYPENADWDSRQCLLYLDVLYNSTVAVYDPYAAKIVKTLVFENVSFNPLTHLSGVNFDRRTGLITILVTAGAPFMTRGQDISGPNFAFLYDPTRDTILWTIDLNSITGGKYSGFQDVDSDPRGNVYVVGTWSSSIIRISPEGKDVKIWYLQNPVNQTRVGFSGIASTGNILLVADKNGFNGSRIVRFDATKDTGIPYIVPLTPANFSLEKTDAVYLPPKYNGRVLLVAVQYNGTAVIVSEDGRWDTAEFKGYIPCASAADVVGSQMTANTQIADSLYTVQEWFDWPPNGSLAGNRTTFPMVDITAEVEALIKIK